MKRDIYWKRFIIIMNCVSCLLINLLQHRISLQFLINRCIGNAKNVINDMNETVRCCNVGLNNCSINTSTLYSYRLVVIFTVHDIEVKEFLFDIRWNLNNLRVSWTNSKKRFDWAFPHLILLPDDCYSTVFSPSWNARLQDVNSRFPSSSVCCCEIRWRKKIVWKFY